MEDKHNEKAKRSATNTVDTGFSIADEAIEKAKETGGAMWEKAKEKGQDFLEDVESGGQNVWKQVRSYVQKRPAQALGYALLCGLVIGFIALPKGRD